MISQNFWPLGLWRNQVPGQLIIQTTSRCNASCPQCGMNIRTGGERDDLALDQIKSMIDAAAERGFAAVSFTGGEPLLRLDELVEMINHAGAAGIKYIRTGTNGYFMARPDKPGFKRRVTETAEKLAATPLRNFWVSLDSAVPEVHEQMRGFTGLVRGLAKAIPIFHEHGLYPSVNLGFNRNLGGPATANLRPEPANGGHPARREARYLSRFRRVFSAAMADFYNLALDLGFTMANTCYPMSLDPDQAGMSAVYAATSPEAVVHFSQAEKATIFQVLLETIPRFRSRMRIFSPLSSLLTLKRQYQAAQPLAYPSQPCRGGLDYFFVEAKTGHAFPCGYRGDEDMGPVEDLQLNRLDRSFVCRRCDWECFRDPSEMLGPLLTAARKPVAAIRTMIKDSAYRQAWLSDLAYYRACEFFDGRRPANMSRLIRWQDDRPVSQAASKPDQAGRTAKAADAAKELIDAYGPSTAANAVPAATGQGGVRVNQ